MSETKSKVECECGRFLYKKNLPTHKKSNIHFKFLKSKKEAVQTEDKAVQTETNQEVQTEDKAVQTETNQEVQTETNQEVQTETNQEVVDQKRQQLKKRSHVYDTKNKNLRYTTKVAKEGYNIGKRYIHPTLYVIELDTGKEREETSQEKQKRMHCERVKRARNKKNKQKE